MSIDIMSHVQATSSQAVERYVLGELTPEEREAFEGHYFDCSTCFERVKLEMEFLRHARQVLGPEPEPEKAWLARMLGDLWRPAPAFACGLVMCFAGLGAYQHVEITDLEGPKLEPTVNLLTGHAKSGSGKQVSVKRKSPLRLGIEFNPKPAEFVSYEARIVAASGKTKFSVPVPAAPGDSGSQDSVTILIPVAGVLDAGSYLLEMHGVTADGSPKKLNQASFELELLD